MSARTAGTRYAVAALAALVGLAGANARAGPPAVGDRFEVRIADLPAPYATASARNPPRRIARPPGATPDVPPGFRVTLFARGLDRPRRLAVAPNGDVLVAESRAGRISLLRDADGDGTAETTATFVRNHDYPYGLAVRGGFLYVVDTAGVWRYAYAPGQTHAASRRERVTPSGAFGRPGGHGTRNLVFSRDGRRFFVAIGSRSNLAEEAPPRATVQVFDADGGGQRTFATGLRNPVGIAFYPGSDDLYVVVNERDGLGDELAPDYLTRVDDGDFFGWPYAYLGAHPQPGFADRRPDLVARAKPPDVPFRAHSAPLGLVFYDADQFPPEYRGDAFVALHGSWNAAEPRGYMVARVPFENGRPAGGYEAFTTGFWASGARRARVWGRPAGLAVAADGSLLIADDAGGAVWRVSYALVKRRPSGRPARLGP